MAYFLMVAARTKGGPYCFGELQPRSALRTRGRPGTRLHELPHARPLGARLHARANSP